MILSLQLSIAAVAAFGCGGSLGSYAGVVAARGWRDSIRGRSRCDGCKRTLRWFELVPCASYVWLRGHCRTCRVRIPMAAICWEAGGALIGLAVALGLIALGNLNG